MRRVFVVDATVPRGGAHMAYHIGRLIHQQTGAEFVNVPITNLQGNIFTYDVPMTTMSREDMEQCITDNDILVCNPSAASAHQFGLRLPGKKVMYIQDFRTYPYLDCHFDVYACVSTVVQDFLNATYQLDIPIIAPFIDISAAGNGMPWKNRPEHKALVFIKNRSSEHMHVYRWMRVQLQQHYPELELVKSDADYRLPQAELLQQVASHRYLLNISIAEGFGLLPLEAMALGTTPFGLNGLAGRDFMQYGERDFCISYADLSEEKLKKMVLQMRAFEPSRVSGQQIAQRYTQEKFYQHWWELLEEHC